MRFLAKSVESPILIAGMVYKKNGDNSPLRIALIKEQNGFCAYTEKYLEPLDSVEVEHFDASKKYQDDYFNYYAVIRKANRFKKDERYRGATFFQTKFFHSPQVLRSRIGYQCSIRDEPGLFFAQSATDQEAKDLIDFLGCNESGLSRQRQDTMEFIRQNLALMNWPASKVVDYLSKHRNLLSFPTAIEAEFQIDLSDIIAQIA
jgi:hypothetical protein